MTSGIASRLILEKVHGDVWQSLELFKLARDALIKAGKSELYLKFYPERFKELKVEFEDAGKELTKELTKVGDPTSLKFRRAVDDYVRSVQRGRPNDSSFDTALRIYSK